MSECPRCKSTAPHLHPAVQHEGEVALCTDAYHLTPTPQNTPEYIRDVETARERSSERLGGVINWGGEATREL